jgi:hypothetical protein
MLRRIAEPGLMARTGEAVPPDRNREFLWGGEKPSHREANFRFEP